jgi:hypothetical protein
VTVHDARELLLDLLEELGSIPGVRGALIATADGALASGARSGLASSVANDVARTVRRMTVASATVGVPLQELLINFGAARMMVIPLRDDATVIALLERDGAVAHVRSLLSVQLADLRELLDRQPADEPTELGPGDETLGEIERIRHGPLGPTVDQVAQQFIFFAMQAGRSRDDSLTMVDEQMREWLLCCNPSPYTLPLLIDGLGQLLNDAPGERAEFMENVQDAVRHAQAAGDRGR